MSSVRAKIIKTFHFHKFNLKKNKIYCFNLAFLYFTCLHIHNFLSLMIKFFLYVVRKRVIQSILQHKLPDMSDASATQTTRVRRECNTNNTSATQVKHEQHECDTSATRVLHECNTSATRVLHEQHECDTSEKF